MYNHASRIPSRKILQKIFVVSACALSIAAIGGPTSWSSRASAGDQGAPPTEGIARLGTDSTRKTLASWADAAREIAFSPELQAAIGRASGPPRRPIELGVRNFRQTPSGTRAEVRWIESGTAADSRPPRADGECAVGVTVTIGRDTLLIEVIGRVDEPPPALPTKPARPVPPFIPFAPDSPAGPRPVGTDLGVRPQTPVTAAQLVEVRSDEAFRIALEVLDADGAGIVPEAGLSRNSDGTGRAPAGLEISFAISTRDRRPRELQRLVWQHIQGEPSVVYFADRDPAFVPANAPTGKTSAGADSPQALSCTWGGWFQIGTVCKKNLLCGLFNGANAWYTIERRNCVKNGAIQKFQTRQVYQHCGCN